MRLRFGTFSFDSLLRRMLPRSLLGRSLLIVLIPLVLLEAVALQIFYGSHLNELSRRLADAVAGEVSFVVDEIDRAPGTRHLILQQAEDHFGFQSMPLPDETLRRLPPPDAPGPVDEDLAAALAITLNQPFTVKWKASPGYIRVNVQMTKGVLSIVVPRKRLYVGALYIFVAWLIGTALLTFAIAALFLRTQVRGIRRLAFAAERFGLGRDSGPIKPEGAIEVRRAATAFNRMQERLRRFLVQRTTMLAGVSHDLRTPLTRLRLALAMLPETPESDLAGMTADIEDMERLINIYLDFARGEGSEQAMPTDLGMLLEEVAASARRAGGNVSIAAPEGLSVTIRPEAMRRALTNLVDNARRHAGHIGLAAARLTKRAVILTVEDDGPGIAEAKRELLFRPFESAEAGGTGLGLAIARDIIVAHGGTIALTDRPGGGLRVVIELPG